MKSLGYEFKNKNLLTLALTHSSYANENKAECNERMEFLGDSVLSIIVSDYLFLNMPKTAEGDLSKIRASLVCEASLSKIAKRIGLGKMLYLGKGEDANCGRERPSILSDAFEAVLAAIYIDGGLQSAQNWALSVMEEDLKGALLGKINKDYKTVLQEALAKKSKTVTYKLVGQEGPDHKKDFFVEAIVDDKTFAKGEGFSKKDAEQSAAKNALVKLGYEVL